MSTDHTHERRLQQGQEPHTWSSTTGGEADTVAELTLETTGRWLVTTHNSQHLVDLDCWTYQRRPGPASQPFPYDGVPLPLLRIQVWPRVGDRMLLWIQDPEVELLEQWRLTSTIRSITPA